MSKETSNILIATLSAGMVGIGDAIGDEVPQNIFRSVRPDGVIVKPDVPLVPIDKSYLRDLNEKGIQVATTYTDHGNGLRITYVFAYSDSEERKDFRIPSSDLGVEKTVFSYDYFAGTGEILVPHDSLRLSFIHDSRSYIVLSPVAHNGIAIVGDPDKFVTCGRQRITHLSESNGDLKATILLAKGETSVSVCGYAPKMPHFLIHGGFLIGSIFDSANHIFRLQIQPKSNLNYQNDQGDEVGKITIDFKASV